MGGESRIETKTIWGGLGIFLQKYHRAGSQALLVPQFQFCNNTATRPQACSSGVSVYWDDG